MHWTASRTSSAVSSLSQRECSCSEVGSCRGGSLGWLAFGWVSIFAAPLLFLQAFGLGGLIASFGLVLDLIGFVLLLLFVLLSSVILLRRETAVRYTGG